MARRKKFRRHYGFTIPLAPTLPIAASFVNNMGVQSIGERGVVGDVMAGRFDYALRDAMLLWTGYDTYNGSWNPLNAKALWLTAFGVAIHKGVGSMLGLNRALGRAKVPIIRI